MFGISISIMLLIGLFSYVDNSQKEIIDSAIEDVNIDMAIYLPLEHEMVYTNQSSTVDSLQAHLQDFGNLYSDSYFVQGISATSPWIHMVSAVNYGEVSINEFDIIDTIILESPNNNTALQSNTSIDFTINWGMGPLFYNWDDNSNTTVAETINFTLYLPLGEGLHNLSVYVQDITGIWAVSYYEFTTDNVAPTVILESPINGTTQQSGTTIDFNVNNSDGYYIYNWDESINTTVVETTDLYIPLGDGLHNLSVYSQDTAGNWAVNYYYFTVNGTALTIILESPINGTTKQSGTIIDLTAIGTDGNLIYNWDDNTNSTVSNTTDLFIPQGDGLHNLSVYAQDIAGNWLMKYYEFITDDTAPTVILVSPINGTTQQAGTIVDLTVIDGDGDLHYNWNGNSYSSVVETANLTLPSVNGLQNLSVYVQDITGNWNLINYQFTIVGGNEPVSGFEDGKWLIGQPVTVLGVSSDYFTNFPGIFQTGDSQIDNFSIFISKSLKASTALNTGDHLNLSVMKIDPPYNSLTDWRYLSNQTFEISGIVNVNSLSFSNGLDSFFPESDEKRISTSDLIVFMNNDLFNRYIITNNVFGLVDTKVLQVKLNRNSLESDISLTTAQIDQFINYVKTDSSFIETTIFSQLLDQIIKNEDQLNQLRLIIIYLSIPGIIIGFYLTRYATDLVLKERKKEISALRSGSISQSQIRNYVVIENLITGLLGILVGLVAGLILGAFIVNSGNLNEFRFYLSTESMLLVVGIGLLLALLSGFNTARTVMRKSIITGLQEMSNNDKHSKWKKYYLDFVILGIGLFFFRYACPISCMDRIIITPCQNISKDDNYG
jgi:ABC-type lipoprotein release transport system permease subunit